MAAEDGHEAVGIAELFKDRRIAIFAASVVLFHFANAAMLPLVGQKSSDGLKEGAAVLMSACIIAAQVVMVPVALAASRLAASWGRKPVFLIGFAVLPVRGLLYCLSVNPYYLVGVQLLDGIGAGIFGVVSVLVVADLTKGTGRFNLTQGALATATGVGAGLSNLLAGFVVKAAGFDAGFIMLAAIAAAARDLLRPGHARDPRIAGRVAETPSDHADAGDHWSRTFLRRGDEYAMTDLDNPVVVVVPGDLHLTEPDLENVRVAHWVVDEVNDLIRPDFVQFIGDNVQDATEAQFRLFDDIRGRLEVPHFALIGDHDVKDDPVATGFRRHVGEPYGAISLRGFRFIRLNTQESRPVGLSAEQIGWFRGEVDAALAAGERVVVFQHNYPYQIWEDFAGRASTSGGRSSRRGGSRRSSAATPITGRSPTTAETCAIATRSIGDPEGGPPGYTLLYFRGDDLAVTYRSIEDRGPVVLVTHPRERLLATGPRHIVSGPDRVVVRTWSESRVWAVRYRIDDGAWAGSGTVERRPLVGATARRPARQGGAHPGGRRRRGRRHRGISTDRVHGRPDGPIHGRAGGSAGGDLDGVLLTTAVS